MHAYFFWRARNAAHNAPCLKVGKLALAVESMRRADKLLGASLRQQGGQASACLKETRPLQKIF